MDDSGPVGARLVEIRAVRRRVVEECRGAVATHPGERPDGWALQDVIEHLVLAERGGFDLIWRAAEAFREGSPVWTGESENEGADIEDIVARTWSTREIAPPSATPTGSGSLASWLAHLWSCDALLERLQAHLSDLPLDRIVYPHFLCGPLDALQRLDFIRFHMEHHLPQVQRLREMAGVDGPGSGSA